MRLDYVATGSCESGEHRSCGVKGILTDYRRQVSLTARRCEGAVKLGSTRKCDVDGLLSREKAFGNFHGGIPACFEHDISLFAERSPASLNSVM